MKKNLSILPAILIALLPVSIFPASAGIAPTGLKTEWMINPLGIDVMQPGLSWLLTGSERGQKQTAYQVIVSINKSNLDIENGDVWNSGRVLSHEQINIIYNGPELKSGTRYFWKVKVWDENDSESEWSPVAWWEMGLLKRTDWKGKWICTAREKVSPYFRKDFVINKKISKATAFVYGLGWYEMHLNGSKVGDQVLTPANSVYSQRLLYDTYDVTQYLKQGGNTAGLWLSDGYGPSYSKYGWRWMDGKRVILQLNIEFIDGSYACIVTDETWKAADSQIISADIYNGETYDATLEKEGWDINGYNDINWQNASVATAPQGDLQSNMSAPVKMVKIIKPVSLKQVAPGRFVYDIGQNIAGWVRLHVKGAPAGTRIIMRHAETVNDDGTINTHTNRKAEATDTYICKGGTSDEYYEPKFTYHGFRYVEVTGYPGTPSLSSINGCAVHAGVEPSGAFSCSDTLINRIHSNFQRTMLNNMVSIITDNPVRDERTPCQMDANCIYEAAIQNFDVQQYFKKWLGDIYGSTSNPDWSAGQVLGPWLMYKYYGDKRILENFYSSAKKEVDHCTANAAQSDFWSGSFGDWCPPFTDGTYENSFSEGEVVNTTLYHYITGLLSEMAGILGKTSDSVRYASKADSIKKTFNDKLFNTQTKKYGSGKQITYIMPLLCGIVPEDRKKQVAENLMNYMTEKCSGHFGTGIYGTSFLPDILCDYGYADLAFDLFTQTTYPGFGYQILNFDATTTWEQWGIIKTGREMETYDHAMFSGADKTFYTRFGGILPLAPGYKTILIRPCIPEGLKYVRSSIKTVHGLVTSDWEKSGNTFKHHIDIPVNTSAVICLPGNDPDKVTENGVKASELKGVRYLRTENNYIVYEAGSGSYSFSCELP